MTNLFSTLLRIGTRIGTLPGAQIGSNSWQTLPGVTKPAGTIPSTCSIDAFAHSGTQVMTLALSALCTLAGYQANNCIHEIGHYLAGRALGYESEVDLDFRRNRFKTNFKDDIPANHWAMIAAAGPATSLVTSAIIYAATHFFGTPGDPATVAAGYFSLPFLVSSVTQLIPVNSAGMKTDGWHILNSLMKMSA